MGFPLSTRSRDTANSSGVMECVEVGVHEYSRAPKTLPRNNSSENHLVSVLGMLISNQGHNAAVSHRVILAKNAEKLPESTGADQNGGIGYVAARHKVAGVEVYVQFIREFARDWVSAKNMQENGGTADGSMAHGSHAGRIITALILKLTFKKNAAERWNQAAYRQKRSSTSLQHSVVSIKTDLLRVL